MKKMYTKMLRTKSALFIALAMFSYSLQAQSYVQSTCAFEPMATAGTAICLFDDAVSGSIPLGFSFEFYGSPFTNCYVSSNGFLTFTSGLGNACCTGVFLPSGTYTNTIFFGQEDLDPNNCIDGDITYYTTGAPGSQIFVLAFTNVPHYPGPEGVFPVTVQVQLHEGTNEIKIVTTAYNGDGGLSTMGLNQNGTNADIVAGRNSANWSASNECISFMPEGGAVCDVTTGLWADGITATGATLHWDAAAGATDYYVSVGNVSAGTLVSKIPVTGATSTTITGLAAGTDYGFQVRTFCVDMGVTAAMSDKYYFSTPARFGSASTSVNLYPNPSNGQFTLALNGYENTSVELSITNSIGQVVYASSIAVTGTNHTESIDLDHVAPGMYQVSLTGNASATDYSIVITE